MLNRLILSLICLGLFTPGINVASDDDWQFPDDNLEERINAVNDGDLNLLDDTPEKPVHHHINKIQILPSSLQDGWVMLEQCHENLDPVAALQIRYNAERIRNVRITESINIASTSVNGNLVELEQIQRQARICILAESQALHQNNDRFELRNGPFMRQFLDGFYPMQVSLSIQYPKEFLQFNTFSPFPGKSGFFEQHENIINWTSFFEGKLYTRFVFKKKTP